MNDKTRDEKRNIFKNLKFLIIDEISLVDSDMFYKIDLRLQEIMNFGGAMGNISVIVLGDLMQMCPISGRYIFLEPRDEQFSISYQIDSLWEKFKCINLEENHRQGEDKEYAEILNRIRVGNQTDEDVATLKERVRTEDHIDISNAKDALYIFGTNKNVNKMNKKRLKAINGDEIVIKAICFHRSMKTFNPPVGNAGEVSKTPFQMELKLKLGAKVMLTYNVDTCDGLTNGARGNLIGFLKDASNNITKLIIKFENQLVGREKRKNNLNISSKYESGTPIEKVNFSFSISKCKKSVINTASVIQFPVKLAFACTAHKVQGLTIPKPLKLIINVMDTFAAAMVYVMLSRVCSLLQLYILNEFEPSKMYPNKKAIEELLRLEKLCLNNNPNDWEKEDHNALKIYSLNCRSLKKHYEDISSDAILLKSDIICLQETWLDRNDIENEHDINKQYRMHPYTLHANSCGRGKGIAIYYDTKKFTYVTDRRFDYLQLSKFSNPWIDVITLYKSQQCPSETLKRQLINMITASKATLVIGDFNFCYKEESSPIKTFFANEEFHQLVNEPTHSDGHILDQAYVRDGKRAHHYSVQVDSKYYSDHRGISIVVKVNLIHINI